MKAADMSRMRERISAALLIGLLALLYSCDRPPDGAPSEAGGTVSVAPLVGKTVSAAPVIGRPFNPRISDDFLWIPDGDQDPGLHLLDARSGELLVSLGRPGEGPGDLSTISTLLVQPGDTSGAVWTWDRGLQRLTRFDPAAPLADPITVQFQVGAGGQAYRVVWLEPDRLVGIHASDEARFSLHAPSGERLRTVPGPLLGSDEVPRNLRIRQTIGSFDVCPWPGRGFVLIYRPVGRIEYYDLDARLVRLADVPNPSDAFVEDSEGGFVPARGRTYYGSCAVANDRLFAAFSGRADADYDGPPTPRNWAREFLHVFDWDGELQEEYRLDPAIHDIVVAPQMSAVFATSLTTAEIYRFPLPSR